MTGLQKQVLGTDPIKGWRFYSLHSATSYILKEFFQVSNYKDCIKNTEGHDSRTRKNLAIFEEMNGAYPYKEQILAMADELIQKVALKLTRPSSSFN